MKQNPRSIKKKITCMHTLTEITNLNKSSDFYCKKIVLKLVNKTYLMTIQKVYFIN